MEQYALRINELLSTYLLQKHIRLIDFKLEFGVHQGQILLGDEISPDTCRLWDTETNEKLDKDRFRRDLGNVEDAYKQILARLTGEQL
jgi:phosphoribosylaminoimidazole-succinocarboxamide synthase